MALSTIPFSGLSSDASNQGVNFRNLIINGDMSIAQRGTSTTGIVTNTIYGCVDRFQHLSNGVGTWTVEQDTNVPTGQGFSKSYKLTCTSANASNDSTDSLSFTQKIEGQNLQHLKFGTSNAESLTLSFWVKSNKTGNAQINLFNLDANRIISNTYTINAVDTWEKKTITFSGDTTGSIDNDNGASLFLEWYLDSGTNYNSGTMQTSWTSRNNIDRAVYTLSLGDAVSNYWQITGVQLEVGTSASDFEFLPYDVNLQRCERYYQRIDSFYCMAFSTTQVQAFRALVPVMRASPTLSVTGAMTITDVFAVNRTQSSGDIYTVTSSPKNIQNNMGNFSSLTSARMYFSTNASSSIIEASAEL